MSVVAFIENAALNEMMAGRPLPESVTLTQEQYDALCDEVLAVERANRRRWDWEEMMGRQVDAALGMTHVDRRAELHAMRPLDGPIVAFATLFGVVRIEAPDMHPLTALPA